MKHLIIINPIDSFAEITNSKKTRPLVFSNIAYCTASVHSFLTSKAFGKDILNFLNTLNDRGLVDVVLLTGVDAEIAKIIATGCNIHYKEIVSDQDKESAIRRIAWKYHRDYSDILLLSAYSSDIYAARRLGALGVFYGFDERYPSASSLDQFIKYLGISKLG